MAASKCALARTASSSYARSRSKIARVRWSTVNTCSVDTRREASTKAGGRGGGGVEEGEEEVEVGERKEGVEAGTGMGGGGGSATTEKS